MKLVSENPIYLESLGLLQSARCPLCAADLILVDDLNRARRSSASSTARAVAAGFLTGPAGSSDFKDEDRDMGMQMAHIIGEKALEPLLLEIQHGISRSRLTTRSSCRTRGPSRREELDHHFTGIGMDKPFMVFMRGHPRQPSDQGHHLVDAHLRPFRALRDHHPGHTGCRRDQEGYVHCHQRLDASDASA